MRRIAAIALMLASAGCATAPAVATAPVASYEDKMRWILTLEDQRVLRAADAPEPPPVVSQPGRRSAALAPARPVPDLLPLLKDEEPRVRRRAALAIGRVGLPDAVAPLADVLAADPEAEVRQMAAFALGLIGHASAADALIAALGDADAIVHGRAAEALGMIGHAPAAQSIAGMMAVHVKAGALQGIAPDDLGYPKAATAEAVRLGAYALVRLAAYDQLASALLDASGMPQSRWWPVAYAFQRVADPKAATVLLWLLQGEGQLTRAFAARGLGVLKEPRAVDALVTLAGSAREPLAVRVEAVRALAAIGSPKGAAPLIKIVSTPKEDANLRLEAVNALGQVPGAAASELYVDLMVDPWPSLRAAALLALARTDPDVFLTAISGLDPDRDWQVRAALATALGGLEHEQARPRLNLLLTDTDRRVIPAALGALVRLGAPDAADILAAQLAQDDFVIRQAAANGLAQLKAARAAEALVNAYEASETLDSTYVARAAILAALVAVDPSAARPILARALSDKDWAMRLRAAELSRTLDPASTAAPSRPAPAPALPELQAVEGFIAPPVTPTAYIDTDKGTIQFELAVLDAPRTVASFISLVRKRFFNGLPIHRVVPNFVVQDGDPRGDGEGGPGYTLRDEINQRPYLRGTVGMALDWADTGGSQFFITHSPQPHLDGRYTVFGRVIEGMEVVDRLSQWDVIRTVRVWDGVSWQ